MKDTQKDKVYAMEAAALHGHECGTVPLPYLRNLANKLCDVLEVPRVTISSCSPGKGNAGIYWYGIHRMALSRKYGRNLTTMLHELAHHIVAIRNPRAQNHGPTWVKTYITLLDSCGVVPEQGMRAACKKHGVKVSS